MEVVTQSGLSLATDNRIKAAVDHPQLQESSNYPFEEYDCVEEQYSRHLALQHKDHMEYYSLGFLTNGSFMLEIVDDVYTNNLYALSWFYDGFYLFDSYKLEKDLYFYNIAILREIEDEVDALFEE
jgi:hypothetical protein